MIVKMTKPRVLLLEGSWIRRNGQLVQQFKTAFSVVPIEKEYLRRGTFVDNMRLRR